MGILLNARPVRHLPTSAQKIASILLAILTRRAKRALSNQPAPKKLVSKMLTKCLLIEQDEYYEHAGRILLAVYHLIGRQVPTLVYVLTGRLSWRVTLRLLKASDAGGLLHSRVYQSAWHLILSHFAGKTSHNYADIIRAAALQCCLNKSRTRLSWIRAIFLQNMLNILVAYHLPQTI
jgi:hypothetical protein